MTATLDNPPLPSRDRVEPGSFLLPPAKFPRTCSTTSVNPDKIASGIIVQLNNILSTKSYYDISILFLDSGYWRDHLCLSWDFRTLKGKEQISNFFSKGCRILSVEVDRSSTFRAPHVGPIDGFGDIMGVEFFTKVTTEVGRGEGVVRLAEIDGTWKISTFFSSLVELNGHEEAVNHNRPTGVQHGELKGRKNWLERRTADINFENKNPAVIIVGTVFFLSMGIANKRRCGPERTDCCRSSENAQCRHPSYRPRGPHWG